MKPPRPGVLFAGMFLTTISIFSGYKLIDVVGAGIGRWWKRPERGINGDGGKKTIHVIYSFLYKLH